MHPGALTAVLTAVLTLHRRCSHAADRRMPAAQAIFSNGRPGPDRRASNFFQNRKIFSEWVCIVSSTCRLWTENVDVNTLSLADDVGERSEQRRSKRTNLNINRCKKSPISESVACVRILDIDASLRPMRSYISNRRWGVLMR